MNNKGKKGRKKEEEPKEEEKMKEKQKDGKKEIRTETKKKDLFVHPHETFDARSSVT